MTDSHFYNLTYSDKTITGLFQASETRPIRRVRIPVHYFLEALRQLCVLGDYDESLKNVYVSDDFEGKTYPAIEWIEWFLADGNDRDTQDAMKLAVRLDSVERGRRAKAILRKKVQSW